MFRKDMSDIHRQINTIARWQEGMAFSMFLLLKVRSLVTDYHKDRNTERMLHWLSPFNYWVNQMDVSRRRQGCTGQWLLADPVFLAWSEGSGQTLWCQGMREPHPPRRVL
jgi:hypothetical protein